MLSVLPSHGFDSYFLNRQSISQKTVNFPKDGDVLVSEDVLLAVDDAQRPVGVPHPDVARVQPP